jgi:tripartite-type tricarboxylate transporter receptor subunit TctC
MDLSLAMLAIPLPSFHESDYSGGSRSHDGQRRDIAARQTGERYNKGGAMFRIIRSTLACALVALPLPAALAADYPTRPVRIIIPFAPGGGTDVTARALQDKLNAAFGQSVIIDNRPGAASALGLELVAKSPPDGYTLALTSASYTFLPGVYKKLPFDQLRDFKPVTMFAAAPNLLVVHPSLPAKNLKQFLALARKRPGDILYSSAGRGSNLHLTTELFNYMAKIKLTQVPYRGGGPSLLATMTGEVQVNFPSIHSGMPFVKAGKLRALGVTTKKRAPSLPDMPTIDEAGVPGYDKAGWFGLFAPSGVPGPTIDRIHQLCAKALKDPAIVKRLAAEGAETVANPPAEFDKFVRDEIQVWNKLITDRKL